MNKAYQILERYRDDLYGKSLKDDECNNFFKNSILHIAISVEISISHYSKEDISFEKICQRIPNQIGSRSSIQSVLNLAVEKGFFVKKELKKDRRIKVYIFSTNYVRMIEEWISFNIKTFSKPNI